MTITKIGMARIEEDLRQAEIAEVRGMEDLNNLRDRVDKLREALICDHSEVESTSSFYYNTAHCKKCGYSWTDL